VLYDFRPSRFVSTDALQLADTAWGTRGQVKTLARNLVVQGYKLKPPPKLYASRCYTKAARQKMVREWTQQRVEKLLADSKFIQGTKEQVSIIFPFRNLNLTDFT